MSLSQWILSVVLLGWVLARNFGTREVTRTTFLVPLLLTGVVVPTFLLPLPSAGHDLDLVASGAVVGLVFGLGAAAATRVRSHAGRVLATTGPVFAGLWLVMVGGRVAFAEWATGAGSNAVGRFSMQHAITGADAWTAAFVAMALAMVLARTVALAVRARVLLSRTAAPATA